MALFSRDKKDEVGKRVQAADAKKSEKKVAQKLVSKKNDRSSTKPVFSEQALSHRVLRRFLITEKGALLAKENKVFFEVPVSVTKTQIGQAVFEAYGIRPTSVRTAVFVGKRRRFQTTVGVRRDWKKAIVTLPEGTSIAPNEAV